jgi:DNA-binding NtrC family response regulator
VGYFLEQSAQRLNRAAPRISQAAMSQLTAQDWPGNVRELQNTVERATILSRGGPLHFDMAGPSATGAPPADTHVVSKPVLMTRDELKRQERDGIAAALKQTGGRISGPGGAAELLGMKPTTLASRIKVLKLNRNTGS